MTTTNRLDVRAFGLGVGVLWASYVMQLAWIARLGWGENLVEALSSMYRGYDSSFRGSIVGAVWGFIDGAVAGAVVGLVYNRSVADGAAPSN